MTDDVPITVRSTVVALIRLAPGAIAVEWRERTYFGKLLFPIWLLTSAYYWVALLSFMAFIQGMEMAFRPASGSLGLKQRLPSIYKENNE